MTGKTHVAAGLLVGAITVDHYHTESIFYCNSNLFSNSRKFTSGYLSYTK